MTFCDSVATIQPYIILTNSLYNNAHTSIIQKNQDFLKENFASSKNCYTFATAKSTGTLAQLVEHRTENPGVPGSIPGGTTTKIENQGVTNSSD